MRPVLFNIGPFHFFGYGAMIGLGGIVASAFLQRRVERLKLGAEDFWLLINVLLLFGFGGGRLLYLFEYTRPWSLDFWSSLISLRTGYSVFGGFVSVPLGLYAFARFRKIAFLPLFDVCCGAAPLSHAFGRVGCFLAGCCHGRPTDAPWGVVFTDPRAQVAAGLLGVRVHPTQLYEAAGNLAIAAGLYRFADSATGRAPGRVAAAYFASYGILRFVEEFYRGDTARGFGGLTAGQCFGVGLVVAAGILWKGGRTCTQPC